MSPFCFYGTECFDCATRNGLIARCLHYVKLNLEHYENKLPKCFRVSAWVSDAGGGETSIGGVADQ